MRIPLLKLLLSWVLVLGVYSSYSWGATDTATKNAEDEWDVLLTNKEEHPERNKGDLVRPDEGGPRGRGWFGGGMVDTKTLLDFLEKYVPSLATKLKGLKEDNPEHFEEQLPTLRRIYGPVIRQMERDPEAAQLTLKKMHLRFKIHKIVEQVKSADSEKVKEFAAQLEEPVGELFEVIIEEEELRLDRAVKRLESFSRRGEDEGDIERAGKEPGPGMGPPEDRGPGRGPGMGRGEGPGRGRGFGRGPRWDREGGPELFRKRLEERKETINAWRERKEQIVAARVKQLLDGYEEFPWGR